MANPQTVEVKVDASKLLGSIDDLSEQFIDRLARRVLERIREIEQAEEAEEDGYRCSKCDMVLETANQLVGHHVAEHGLTPTGGRTDG